MLPDPYPAGREQDEARRATHDGYIWPYPRHQMVTRKPITDRMIEDIESLVRDGGDKAVVTLEDLGRKGWHPAQLAACGRLAFAYFNADPALPGKAAGRRARPLPDAGAAARRHGRGGDLMSWLRTQLGTLAFYAELALLFAVASAIPIAAFAWLTILPSIGLLWILGALT